MFAVVETQRTTAREIGTDRTLGRQEKECPRCRPSGTTTITTLWVEVISHRRACMSRATDLRCTTAIAIRRGSGDLSGTFVEIGNSTGDIHTPLAHEQPNLNKLNDSSSCSHWTNKHQRSYWKCFTYGNLCLGSF